MGHSLFNGKEKEKGLPFHVEIQAMPSEALVFNFKEGKKDLKAGGGLMFREEGLISCGKTRCHADGDDTSSKHVSPCCRCALWLRTTVTLYVYN